MTKYGKKEKLEDCVSSQEENSDSEYYSPKESTSKSPQNFKVQTLKQLACSAGNLNEALEMEYKAALHKNQRLEKKISDMRSEKQRAMRTIMDELLSQLKDKLGVKERDIPAYMQEVDEVEVSAWMKDLKELSERRQSELRQAEEENSGLRSRISELEKISEDKGDEIRALTHDLEDKEKAFEDRELEFKLAGEENMGLKARVLELERVSEAKGVEIRDLIKDFEDKELHSTRKIEESSANVENLQQKMDSLLAQKNKLEEENQNLISQVKDLNSELDDIVRTYKSETGRFSDEKEGLQKRISELEQALTSKENEFSNLQKKVGDDTAVFESLMDQNKNLQQMVDSLQTEKTKLEARIDEDKRDYSKNLSQLETETSKLTSTVADQNLTLKAKEDKIIKLSEAPHRGSSLIVSNFISSSPKAVNFQRKMDDLAEEFRMNIHDKILLLYRRIHVLEQLHSENKENYRMTKAMYEKESRILSEKTNPNYLVMKKKELAKMANSMMSGLEDIAKKLEGKNKQLQKTLRSLKSQVNGKNIEKSNMAAKGVNQLEEQVRNMEKVAKEKDEVILSLREEKKEAIRQLCMSIDYHCSRCDYLKGLVIRKNSSSLKKT